MRLVMGKDLEGEVSTAGESFAIVVSRYNEMVTRRLLNGALETFKQHGVPDERIVVAWYPALSRFRLSRIAWRRSGRFAGVCCRAR